MEFGLSAAQILLRDSIADFLAQHADLDRVRTIQDSESGHDPELTRALGDQGVTGLLIGERWEGTGLGLLDASVAAQQFGYAATPISFHSTFVLAPLLIGSAGSEQQQSEWLPRLARGEAIVAPVLGVDKSGTRLEGSAMAVPDGHAAEAFLVETGDALWLVPCDRAGIRAERLHAVDETRPLTEVTFEGVELDLAWELESFDRAVLERALAAARIALAADSLGACYRAIQLAVEYSLGREQFGRTIGSFQAVKHLCAEMIAAVDPIQSLLWQAAWSWDQEEADSAWLAPLLKAHASEVGTQTVTDATQVFGGMGFTWECDMHLFYKRVGYDRQLLGGPAQLRALAAELQFGPAGAAKTA